MDKSNAINCYSIFFNMQILLNTILCDHSNNKEYISKNLFIFKLEDHNILL